MKRFFFLPLLTLLSFCFSDDDIDWIHRVQNRLDTEVVEWAKSIAKQQEHSEGQEIPQQEPNQYERKTCKKCSNKHLDSIADPKLYVFMSFSLPDTVWLSLDREVQRSDAVFVLRGLPSGSFQELSKKILNLKEQGLTASIQINPMLFKEFSVEHVPSFVVRTPDGFDKVRGNVSLGYAVTVMGREGAEK